MPHNVFHDPQRGSLKILKAIDPGNFVANLLGHKTCAMCGNQSERKHVVGKPSHKFVGNLLRTIYANAMAREVFSNPQSNF